jgi:uncharacterized membrane-anchored protein YitT (DUF2179 family)
MLVLFFYIVTILFSIQIPVSYANYTKKEPLINTNILKNTIIILIGAVIAAVGLQFFLIPNHLTDGGVVGLSIIGSQLSHIPIGIFLVVLNLPFIYLGYEKLGKAFALYSAFGIVTLSILTSVIHSSVAATTHPILAAVFGGAIVGVGVGLVIRYGGTLDGADTVAILIDKKTPFSVGEAIMFINIFILSASGFVFGWDNAMYSLIAYYVAHKAIDVTAQGLDESKSVWIVSRKYKEIGAAIQDQLGEKVTYVNGKKVNGIISDGVMLVVITRMQEMKLKALVRKYDRRAFIVINDAHEIIRTKLETS